MSHEDSATGQFTPVAARKRLPSRLQVRLSHWGERAGLYLVIVVLAFFFALPFIWMASSSLKDDPQTYHVPPIWIPNPLRWANYPEVLTSLPFGHYFLNTMTVALPTMAGVLVSSALAAYGFSRIRWRGRDALFFICLATMMLPFQVRMIPLFITFRQLGWINTFLPLIVPPLFGDAYFIFMLRQFFMTIPSELSDAAKVDGCSELGIFTGIILPLSKPALAVVALFQFMWAWNDYLEPLIYLNDETMFTIALGLQLLRASTQAVSRLVWPYLMAASTATLLPILIIFFFTQRTFVEGISVTGIKG
jgi:multiple sugar transport system permease protein